MPSAKPVELANLFVEETSAAEVRKALSVLLQTGFLKEQNGKLSVVEKSVSTPDFYIMVIGIIIGVVLIIFFFVTLFVQRSTFAADG